MNLRITSGLQTGVDRAAADTALCYGIWLPGYVPRGRMAEDGPIPLSYDCIELPTNSYEERTRKNVERADATVLLTLGPLVSRGSSLTKSHAMSKRKPFLRLDMERHEAAKLITWLKHLQSAYAAYGKPVVNIAGPRESGSPGIYDRTKRFLVEVFDGLRD